MKMRFEGLFFIVLLFYMYLSSLSFQSHSDPLPSPSPASQSERQEEFCRTRSKLMQLWEELEIEPHQEFEQLVAKGDVNKFGLTVENMSRLNKFYAEVSDEQCLLLSYSITKSSLPPSLILFSWKKKLLTWRRGLTSYVSLSTLSGRDWKCRRKRGMHSHSSTLATNQRSSRL